MAVNIIWSLASESDPAQEPHEMLDNTVETSASNGEVFDLLNIYLRHSGTSRIKDCGLYLAPYSSGQQVGQLQTPAQNFAEFIDWGNSGLDDGSVPVDSSTYGGIYLGVQGNLGSALSAGWQVHKTGKGNSVDTPIPLNAFAIKKAQAYEITDFTSPNQVTIAEDLSSLDPVVNEAYSASGNCSSGNIVTITGDIDEFYEGAIVLFNGGLRKVTSVAGSDITVSPTPSSPYSGTIYVVKDLLMVKGHSSLDETYVITDVTGTGPTIVTAIKRDGTDFFTGAQTVVGNIEIARAGVIDSGGEANIVIATAVPSGEDQSGTRYVDNVLKFTE